jgi:hypothetical protein
MTKQELYDGTREWFSQPDATLCRREGPGIGQCFYRWDPETEMCYAEAPLRCAAGVHIPNHLYNEKMEGVGFHSVLEETPELSELLGLGSDEKMFVQRMQRMHDKEAASAADFVVLLDAFAHSQNLIVRG